MAEAPLVHVVDDDDWCVIHCLFCSRRQDFRFVPMIPRRRSSRRCRSSVGCLLTDVQMPELNGLELQRRMGELGIRMPVIVMTGHGDVPIAVEAMKAGATDFLEKPFEDCQLLAAINSAIAISQRRATRPRRWPTSPRGSPP